MRLPLSYRFRIPPAAVFLFLIAPVLVGCGGYRLQGRVIEGPTTMVAVVDADDPRLVGGDSIAGAQIEVILDPGSISPSRQGGGYTDEAGWFSIPVNAIGAGSWQAYELGVATQVIGYRDIWHTMPLPSDRRRLLIIMQTGQGGRRPPMDLYDESRRLQDQFMSP